MGTYSFLGRLVDVAESGPMDQVISKCDFWLRKKTAARTDSALIGIASWSFFHFLSLFGAALSF